MKDVVASSDSGAYSKVTKNVCVTVVPHFWKKGQMLRQVSTSLLMKLS